MQGKLFQLIAELSKGEKRHFHIFAQRHVSNNSGTDYLKLFRRIESAPNIFNIDEKALWKDLGDKYHKKNNQYALKSYLHQMLLRSLRSFHEKFNVERKINELFFESKILEKKRLYGSAQKHLNIAVALARKYEYLPRLIEILRFQKLICIRLSEENLLEKITAIREEMTAATEMIDIENQIREYYEDCFMINRTERSLVPALEELNEELDEYWATVCEKENMSVNAQLNYGAFKSYFYEAAKNHEKRKAQLLNTFKVYEKKPHFKEELFKRYMGAIYNFISPCVHLKDEEGFKIVEAKLKAIKPKSIDQEVLILDYRIYAQIMFLAITKNYVGIKELGEQKEASLDKFKRKMLLSRKLVFYFNFAFGCYLANDKKSSLKWIKKLKPLRQKDFRPDIQIRIKILETLNHYYPEDYDMTEAHIRSALRFMRKYFPKKTEEILVLKGIKRTLTHPHLKKDTIEELESKAPIITSWEELQHWKQKLLSPEKSI